ncbi:MAG: acyl-CoA dehydrogenase family protein [Solirubrobacteraceae bacterium]
MAVSATPPAATAELEELRAVLRRFLAAKSPVLRTLEVMESAEGYDRAVWQQMSEQLALPALIIPERYGGQGYGMRELGVVLEELGRVVYMGPLFATTVLATHALVLSGDEDACDRLLPQIAGGACTATLAAFERGRGWAPDALNVEATPDGVSWRLNGSKDWVLDGATADVLLVSARSDDGASLFLVERASEGVEVEPISVLDLTRPLAAVSLDGARATRIAGADVVPAVLRTALAALACEQAGGAQACLEMTVAYAGERLQFGRPIGSYQAVRHRCADMFVAAEMASATARGAARAIAEDDPDREVAVAVAKSYCSEAFLSIAECTIQLHGGIGFTWEHPAHLYFKRAKSSALMFGDPAAHRARIAPALLEPLLAA